MRRAVRTVAAVALFAAAAPVARVDAAPAMRWRLWRVTRVDSSSRPVGMDVAVTASAPGALALVVGVRGTGSNRRVVTSVFWEDGGTRRAAYRDGTSTPLCDAGTCAADDADTAQIRVGNNAPIRDDYLVLTYGASARVTFDRPGWRAREVAPPRVRRVVAVAARGTGATTGSATMEHYEGTSATGGAGGSVAWASVPCDGGGIGDAVLAAAPSTARSSQSLTCADGATEGAALAPRGVRWTVTGQVVGVAHEAPVTRLLVADVLA